MPGLFTVGAQLYGAKQQADREEQDRQRVEAERQKRQQQEDEDRARNEELRKLQMAATLAAMGDKGIVRNDQRDQVTMSGAPARTESTAPTTVRTAMPIRETPDLVHGSGTVAPPTSEIRTELPGTSRTRTLGTPDTQAPDPRYKELGDTGYSVDENPPLSIVEQRKRAEHQRIMNQRVAALRAKHPERYGQMGDQELAGIVEDDDAYREALKEVKKPAPVTRSTDKGIMEWDEASGTWKPTGMKPPPRASTPENPTAVKREERLALQSQIEIKQRQLEQIDKAITAAGDPKFTPGDATAKAAAQAAYDRKLEQKTKLAKEVDDLVARMDGQDKTQPTPEWMKGVKLDEKGGPSGLDLSAADKASPADQEKAQIAAGRIRRGEATMNQLIEAKYLSPAMRALTWRMLMSQSDSPPAGAR